MLSLFSNSTASRNFLMEILRISCFTVWKHTASREWILGKLYPPRTSQQVLSAPFGKLRRFCPIYDFSSDNSGVSRSCLQADTGVIRLQPYLRQTSLNFPKWEMLSFVQHLTVTEVKLVFSHIACSPEAAWEDRGKYNGKSTWLPSVRTEMQIHTRLMQIQGTETNSDLDCSLLRPSSDWSPVTQKMR